MSTLFGRATYPGVRAIISADYTSSHGIAPGLISFTISTATVVGEIAPIGDVVFTDGERAFTLPGCIAADLKQVRGGDGYVYQLSLYDRRWKWQFGGIDGRYNERDNANKIRPETKMTVHEIAEILLLAMGEKKNSWDLGDLPNPVQEEELPAFNWEAENPAKALAELAEAFSCRVIYQPIRDRVLIAMAGKGEQLPSNDYTEYTPGMSKPVIPQSMEFVGGPMAFLAAMKLEPMAEELDGSIVELTDVSYKPADGWHKGVPPFFSNVVLTAEWEAKGKKKDDAIAAAKKSVWRYYRVTVDPLNDGPFEVPGLSEMLPDLVISEAWQMVPLDRVIGVKRDQRRQLYSDPPKVIGEHYDGNANSGNSSATALVKARFNVDSARGLVVFDNYVRRWDATLKGPIGADIVLVTSVYVRDQSTKQVVRFRDQRTLADDRQTQPMIVRREDVQYSHLVDFRLADWTFDNSRDNLGEVTSAADKFLDQADNSERSFPEQYAYPRILLIDPDGAISQVTWSVSGACSTRASRNTEHSRYVPPFKFQRGKERTDQAMNKLKSNLGDTLKFFGGLT